MRIVERTWQPPEDLLSLRSTLGTTGVASWPLPIEHTSQAPCVNRHRPTRVLVVGQTPPPYGGQTIMIQHLLDGVYPGYEILHQRMAFSREMEEVGSFKVRKLLELVRVIAGIVVARITRRPKVLYYPPAGPSTVPVIRDLAILGATRWMFGRTVFHFHAGGVSEFAPRLPAPLRPLFRLAYRRPDAAIRVSRLAAPDPANLEAVKEFIVPNAIEDHGGAHSPGTAGDGTVELLYLGLLSEAKGVEVLLEACGLLAADSPPFRLRLVGPVESVGFERRLRRLIADHRLETVVSMDGELTGAEKWAAFAAADMFCFPTHHPSETFGIVLLEALSFSLPVVATRWRGTADIVADGGNGFLVPTGDAPAMAARIAQLIADPIMRQTMGEEGRRRFLEYFTLARYHAGIHRVLESVADGGVPRGKND